MTRGGFSFYLISFVLAVVFMMPRMAQIFDVTLPFQGLLSLPATGFGYMCVFFHEIGHTLTMWVTGYPAIPTFDFNHGGGMTYSGERMMWVVYGVMACLPLSAAIFWYRGYHYIAAGFAVFFIFYLCISFNAGHEIFWLYMGHGAEILAGCFCLLRGIIGHGEYGVVERWLNMIFGFFILLENAVMSLELIFHDISRMAYEAQKGGHGFGDFSRIADIADVSLQMVAGLSFALLSAFVLLTVLVGARHRRHAGL